MVYLFIGIWNIWIFILFLSVLSILLWDKILIVLVENGKGLNFYKKVKVSFILVLKKNDEFFFILFSEI